MDPSTIVFLQEGHPEYQNYSPLQLGVKVDVLVGALSDQSSGTVVRETGRCCVGSA
jgi:hypothetical protein